MSTQLPAPEPPIVLTPADERQLLTVFNDTWADYPRHETMISLFEQQVARTPDQPALLCGDQQLSYRELQQRVNQLANYLRGRGIGAQTLVSVCMPRTVELVVSLLAILKAGGAYVPIDPAYPRERIQYMLQDSQSALVLTTTQEQVLLAGNSDAAVVCLDTLADELAWESTELALPASGWHELAYVIYTSGSTGQPKGVMIEHGNAYTFVRWCQQEYAASSFEVVYAGTSICFDLSIYEIFYTLSIGRVIRLLDSGLAIAEALERETSRAVLLNTVPSIIRHLLNEGIDWQKVTVINMAGEPIPVDVHQRVDLARIEVRNLYGPSEDTTYSTCQRLLPGEPVLIGRPIANTQAYIVNEHLQLLPLGAVGELCLAGDGLSRGYLNKAELTREKFLPNPFPGGDRLYRTGDLARWRPDGIIEYLGRLDTQVKIRGYRIELGEVETRLQQAPGVAQAVVLARPDAAGALQLVGYVVPGAGYDPVAVQSHLRVTLPEYMVPAAWVELDVLPLTPNGKVDKKALPEPQLNVWRQQPYVAPRTETEQTLAGIWQRLLEVEQVGVHDDFFALGGHSLLAARLMVAIEKQTGTRLPLRTVLANPTVEQLARQLGQASAAEEELVPQERPARLPLAFMQEGLWLVDQMEGSVHYNVPLVLRLHGELHIAALTTALRQLVVRHEALRTVVLTDEQGAYQQVLPAEDWQPEPLTVLAENQTEADVLRPWLEAPFDLAHDYMMRAHLLRVAEQEHLLAFSVHHIACDGWSLGVMVRDLAALYEATLTGAAPALPALDVQFADYALWQRRHLTAEALAPSLDYWKNQLHGLSPLQLPTDYERPAVPSRRGGLIRVELPAGLQQQLEQVSQQAGATLFMGLLAGFQALLARYSGQTDICVGTPVAGRTQAREETMVGLLVNTLVLRGDVSGNPSFAELLQRVKQTTLAAYAHQHVPVEQIVAAVAPERDLSRNPLFQVMFALQNIPEVPLSEFGGLRVQGQPYEWNHAKCDLTVEVDPTGAGCLLRIEYSRDLFEEATIHRLVGHFRQVLTQLAADPQRRVQELELLTAAEQHQLLHQFNDTRADYPQTETLVSLFEQQVARTPERPALRFGAATLSYRELNEQANQLAYLLRAQAIRPGERVGVLARRSPDMLVALLGILKSGAVYVPLNTDYPASRLRYIAQDAALQAVVCTHPELRTVLPDYPGPLLSPAEAAPYPTTNPPLALDPEAGVYVMYTSGTTGQAKGIQVTHRNVIKLAFDPGPIQVQPTDTVLQWSNFAFDGSTYDIYGSLLCGACLQLIPESAAADADELAAIITEHQVSVAFVTTALFNALADTQLTALRGLRKVLFGGELVSVPHVQRALRALGPDKIVHVYGPTETTTYATSYAVRAAGSAGTVPIGYPLANTQAYVLDAQRRPVPVGCPGELYIGGAGVAPGYLNKPELTAERFVDVAGLGRLYRTGDLVRWQPDGALSYLGRLDDQVKIRGYRVELGEIETLLQTAPAVAQAVVTARRDASGTLQLVAHVVPEAGFSVAEASRHLRQRLPEYMVPAAWVELDVLPLTPNGKVDKKALPEPQQVTEAEAYVAPRTTTEQALAEVWQQLLKRERVGVEDNFFALGGHSLLATRLVAAIRHQLGRPVTIRQIFSRPTIAGLAELLDQATDLKLIAPLTAQPRPDRLPLSFAQERLWFIDQLEGSGSYTIPLVLRLRGELHEAALTTALRQLVARHEALRTVIGADAEGACQRVLPAEGWQPEPALVLGAEQTEAEVLAGWLAAEFDLSRDYMLRAHRLQLSEQEHLLALVVHHIACDGWSLGIMVRELEALYLAAAENRPAALPALDVQYADYALWQRQHLTDEALADGLRYWKNQLNGLSALQLPTDHERPAVPSGQGGLLQTTLPRELQQQLEQVSQQAGATLFMGLLAGFQALLARYSGQTDICVGTPVAGRTQAREETMVGLLVNTLALRGDVSGNPSFSELLQRVKQTTLAAFAHQHVPFERVVEVAAPERDLSRNPLFQVMFSLYNAPAVPEAQRWGQVLELSTEEVPWASSKFDLGFDVDHTPEGLVLSIEYSRDLFDEATIARLLGHYQQLLTALATDPAQTILDVDLLSAAERRQLVHAFNDTARPLPLDRTVDQLIDAVADATPDRTAIVHGQESISYGALRERAEQTAAFLHHELQLPPQAIVGVLTDRSISMLAGIYGVWKAGGAYVPLHPELPADRLAVVLDDAQVAVLLYEEKYAALARSVQQRCAGLRHLVCLDARGPVPAPASASQHSHALPTEVPAWSGRPAGPGNDGLAYVLYTSGSTGRPKGAMVEHKGMLNHLLGMIDELQMSADSRMAQNASQSFDVSVWQMFVALIVGGQTVILGPEVVQQPADFVAEVTAKGVTVLEVVPSYLSVLLEETGSSAADAPFASLRQLLVTGETVTRPLLARWFRQFPQVPVVNAYGPTEAADDVTLHHIHALPERAVVPIGKPIQNTRIYIVNERGQLCPLGVKGEIWVAGAGVGRGYVNDAAKTAAAFGFDPFGGEAGVPLYRTGDLGRWLPDGSIEFFGRRDYQVKIRGHRIELGEIEQHLVATAGVKEAVVVDRRDAGGHTYLCAYFTADAPGLEPAALTQALAARLPGYMLPTYLMELPALPLTPNGKVDRRALPAPEAAVAAEGPALVAPRTELEIRLAAIWRELLGQSDISVTDNFFALGGHSLKVTQLTARIYREFGVKLPLRAVFAAPTLEGVAAAVGQARYSAYAPIPRVAEQPVYETSNAQKRLWIIDQLADDLVAYNSFRAYRLRGELNVEALQAAVDVLVARHESLRTTFVAVGGEPKQRIHLPGELPTSLDVVDYRRTTKSAEEVAAELARRGRAPMNLATGPLFQMALYRLPDQSYYLFCVMHHIICDGWSNNLLIDELLTAYQALADGHAVPLPALPLQYKDYAAWQTAQLATPEFEAHRQYWLRKLGGELPVLNFPSYRPRPAVQTFNGRTLEHQFAPEALQALRQLGARADASLFMTLTALLNLLLYKYTGQADLVVGAATAGRSHPDLENQIGYYLNTVALRNEVQPAGSFEQLLRGVRQNMLEAFEHQDYPFDLLISQLDGPRDPSRNPVFDVLIILQNFDQDETGLLHQHLRRLQIEPLDIEGRSTVFDLDFDFTESSAGLALQLSYNTDLYEDAQMAALLRHFEALIGKVAAATDQPLAHFDVLTDADRRQLAAFNDNARDFALDLTYHQYVERFARETPAKTAVICREARLSYQELNARANQLARAIGRHVALGEDDLVAVYMDRSENMLASILAVWKSAAAYIPVETKFPLNRVEGIVHDAGAKLVVAQRSAEALELRQRLWGQCPVLFLDELLAAAEAESQANLERVINPDSLAFVIFTSGSTGKPKGAMNEHRGRMNHALATAAYLGQDADTVLVQNASHGFDISVWQSFNAFVTGGTTLIYDDELVAQPELLLQDLLRNRATVLQVVPSYLSVLLDLIEKDRPAYDFALRHLISCGERLPPALAQRWFASYPAVRMVNDYGPAEASDGTSWYVFDAVPEGESTIPIGWSVHNITNYVVDEHLNLCPIGALGELCVAGVGVGRGYVNDPERTARAFMTDPFAPEKNQRLYRTGDLARWRPDGLLEFHGRKDYQVKVNGQRIELGEIETRLTELSAVADAVVIDREDATGRRYLTAFVVPADPAQASAARIKEALGRELPPYMIPRRFHLLDALPVTANGKIDRKLLARWEAPAADEETSYCAPATEAEELLAEAWAAVLRRERMGVTENFYDAGGDSISAIQVASRLYKQGYRVDIRDIMRQPTIRELAGCLRPLQRVAEQGPVTGPVPLTPIQADFFSTAKTNPEHYHQSLLLTAAEPLQAAALRTALNQLLTCHDALRLQFAQQAGELRQFNAAPGLEAELRSHDLRAEADPWPRMEQLALELQAGYNLATGPLLKALHLRTATQDYLLLCAHHLVVDGVSWRILLEDLTAFYQAAARGEAPELPVKTDSFKLWAEQLRAYAHSPAFTAEQLYWQRVVDLPADAIPHDLPSAAPGTVADLGQVSVELDAATTERLLTQAHQAFGTEVNDLLLTALGLATRQTFGTTQLRLMLESHGRSQQLPELSVDRTVGWFTAEYPVHLDLNPAFDLARQLKEVKENLHKVPHNGTGYGLLRFAPDALATERPRPQLVFNYLGQLGNDEADAFFRFEERSLGRDEAPENRSDYELELIGSVQQGRLTLTLHYHRPHFLPATIEAWMQAYRQQLGQLVDFCTQRDTRELTPSDFAYSELSFDDLDALKSLFD
ncbi:amino acid adenylation domain-containing protein [Hymenobacter sp. B81]|uniref:amino acid adenylation domain-containing protein n=1 Tax=Hymenobacter sp. B81 TaxID=3344878 RepID=UPI0037DCEA6F